MTKSVFGAAVLGFVCYLYTYQMNNGVKLFSWAMMWMCIIYVVWMFMFRFLKENIFVKK